MPENKKCYSEEQADLWSEIRRTWPNHEPLYSTHSLIQSKFIYWSHMAPEHESRREQLNSRGGERTTTSTSGFRSAMPKRQRPCAELHPHSLLDDTQGMNWHKFPRLSCSQWITDLDHCFLFEELLLLFHSPIHVFGNIFTLCVCEIVCKYGVNQSMLNATRELQLFTDKVSPTTRDTRPSVSLCSIQRITLLQSLLVVG